METKDLVGHLNREIELFKELVSTLHRETECVVSRDYKGLYETVGAKEQLVMRINASGAARASLIKGALEALGADAGMEANLSSVIELAGTRGRGVEECQERLISLSSTVHEINRLNSAITESSIENVAKTLGFLGHFMQPSTYKATGSFDGFALKGSRLSEGA